MLKKYSIFQIIALIIDVLKTKLMFPKARLIRSPSDIRGKKYISIDEGFTTGRGSRLEAYPISDDAKSVLFIGKNVEINDYVHITAMQNVTIGDNVLIASKVYISDCVHGSYKGDHNDSSPLSIPKDRPYSTSSIIIENNVWLGEFVSVLPGVTIGQGSIIGTMSVVSKSIPPFSIAVGSPAKVIKTYNFDLKMWVKTT